MKLKFTSSFHDTLLLIINLLVAGMGAMALFENWGEGEECKSFLRVGGHQLRVFQGEPEKKGPPGEDSFPVTTAVPCLTLTLRVEPHR